MSKIVDEIIVGISRALAVDSEYLKFTVKQCEAKGVLTAQELRQLSEMGIPITNIGSNVLGIKANEFFEEMRDKETREWQLSYGDLLCILGIFAQNCMISYQQKRISKYNG